VVMVLVTEWIGKIAIRAVIARAGIDIGRLPESILKIDRAGPCCGQHDSRRGTARFDFDVE